MPTQLRFKLFDPIIIKKVLAKPEITKLMVLMVLMKPKKILYTVIPRRERTISMITPGPDAYEQFRQERVKSFKIGMSKREGIFQKSNSPGPGDYDVQAIKESVGYTIGRGQRDDTKLEVLPGPASYKPHKPSNAPKYSIYQRYREKTDNQGPGPQSYTIGEFRETKSIIFGQAKRDSYNKIQIQFKLKSFSLYPDLVNMKQIQNLKNHK